jgi:hypothetical protein
MGRKGGSSQETALRKAVREDEALREKAKRALADALDGNDERRRFEAAKSLFSFRADTPPQERQEQEERRHRGGVFSLESLFAVAAERGILQQMGVSAEAEAEVAAKTRQFGETARRDSFDPPEAA